jgi:hypothetical protein
VAREPSHRRGDEPQPSGPNIVGSDRDSDTRPVTDESRTVSSQSVKCSRHVVLDVGVSNLL